MKRILITFLILTQGRINAQCDTSLSNSIVIATLKHYHNTLNKLEGKELLLADSACYTSERGMMLVAGIEKELEAIVGDQKQAGELVAGLYNSRNNKGRFSALNKCDGIKTINSCVFKQITQKNGWVSFRKKFPNAIGFYIATMPYINSTKDKASIVVEHACGSLCGECYKFILILNNDTNIWEVKYKSALFYH